MSKNSFTDLVSEHGAGYAILVIILTVIFALGLIFGFMCLEACILMALWNAIIPCVFITIGPITFWQMMGLELICTLLLPGGVSGVAKAINKD
jgi:hypothetical protein